MKNKVLWFLFFFFLGAFLSKLYYGPKKIEINSDPTEKNKIEKINFDFLNKVEVVMKEKFVDTREDKSKKISIDDKVFGAAQGLVASYGDMHTAFFPPEDNKEFRDDLSGEFSGIGAEISNNKGLLVVVAPLPGSPAEKAGLRPKDVIIEIDGKDSSFMSPHKAVKLIRGKRGSIVKLKVLRKSSLKPVEIKIKRDNIKIPIVKSFVKDGVFVIKLYSFTENSSKEFFKEILKKFRKSKTNKMIIDLRNNSGGFLSAGIFITGLFLEEGKEIVREDYEGKQKDTIFVSGDMHARPDKTTNIFNNLELAILMNNGTASAAEILAGSLSDHSKAILLGENSFGKGTVQEMVDFDNGSSLKVTIAKFILPKRGWISYKGIEPDKKIEMPESEYEKVAELGSFSNYVDKQLAEAIKFLKRIKSYSDFQSKIKEFSKKREENNNKKKLDKIKEILEK